MEDIVCELGDIFLEGSVTCVDELCLRCAGGIWEPVDLKVAPGSVKDKTEST